MGRARVVGESWTWFTASSRGRLLLLVALGILALLPVGLAGLVGGRTSSAMGQEVTGDLSPLRDPYLVEEDGIRYLFSTGDAVQVRRSADGQHWEEIGTVFSEGLPDWTDDVAPGVSAAWAPSLAYFEGRWHLYYSVSTFGTWTSAVGLATSPTLHPDDPDYGWTDQGMVVSSDHDDVVAKVRSGEGQEAWNAIDPYPVVDAAGDPWLAWGSFAGGLYLQRLDATTGLLEEDAPVHRLARRSEMEGIEATNLVEREGVWYLFSSWDFCCRGVQSTYTIRVGRSFDLTGPYADQRGRSLLDGGGSLVLGNYDDVIGPGHSMVLREDDDWFIAHHFYDAASDGTPTLSIRPLLWTVDGWPVAADPGFVPAGPDLPEPVVEGSWEVTGYERDHPEVAHDLVRFDLDGSGEVGVNAGVWGLHDGIVTMRARPDCDGPERIYELFVDETATQMHGRVRDGAAVRAQRVEPAEDHAPACSAGG